ncbi:phosphate ABC transporter substrate-binding protein PstS [Mycolicibacterium fallax]|uniref:Phosphate-binding protein n=1 Tax=Mycolicibacterium fallax TaxID=1793 RepID=A0A1X1R3X8_MYCFA|nr:phosphate ABC transporter substrate-binding protein PstS [Mycolicibacterium fallax]ORU99029.1 phosphate-binding protein [Mycolicibacterium fallax]BBZ00068.1 phosphate-binding protein PstS [Mycolicibacterium fallax]HOW93165.1 phosphate ABC transporter substrate-binding protein PstS [Mycolicibacterium fallax]
MNLSKVGRALLVTASAAALAVTLAGCGSDDNSGSGGFVAGGDADCQGAAGLTAEGSTAQQNAIGIFNKVWGQACPGKNLSYNPTGSGAGITQFVSGNVDFAGSDSPMDAEQAAGAAKRCDNNPAWHLPLVFGPVALAYQLPGVEQLAVSPQTLAGIFTGAITRWNDPALVALNPDQELPDTPITPVYRSDSSGTTDNFQKYLAAAAPQDWTKGAGKEFQGGAGEGAQKSAGIVQAVQVTPGAIGYVEKGFADQAGLSVAAIDSGGGPVALTGESAKTAIAGATFVGAGNDLVLDLDALYAGTAPGAYPLMLVTYNIVCSRGYSPELAAAVRSFLTVAADHGQAGLDTIGYVALPESIKTRLVAAARAIQ